MELTFVSARFDIKVGAVADLVVPSGSLTDGELQRLVTLSLPEAGAAGGGHATATAGPGGREHRPQAAATGAQRRADGPVAAGRAGEGSHDVIG